MKTTLTVNGRPRTLDLDPRVTLLDALRDHLHLTGSKKGCDIAYLPSNRSQLTDL